MDLPSSDKLNLITDPETGLELVSRRPDEETPEQSLERLFWQVQFTEWLAWRAGDVLAIGRALSVCLSDRPLPLWLFNAVSELCVQSMSAAEKRARRDMNKHYLRWKAVKLVRGRHPNDTRNYKKKVRGDAVWEEAAKLLADEGVKAETVRKSYELIEDAGGAQTTLPSYKREVKVRDRRRKRKKKKKFRVGSCPSSLPRGRLLPEQPTVDAF